MPLPGAQSAVDVLGGLRGIWISPTGLAAISVDAVAGWLYLRSTTSEVDRQWVREVAEDLGLGQALQEVDSDSEVTTYRFN